MADENNNTEDKTEQQTPTKMAYKAWQAWEYQMLEHRFKAGFTDDQIAEALMRTVPAVIAVRKQRGLLREGEEKKKPETKGEEIRKAYEIQKELKEQNYEIIAVLKEIRDILQRTDASILDLAGQGKIAADIQKKKLEMITKDKGEQK